MTNGDNACVGKHEIEYTKKTPEDVRCCDVKGF